MSKQKLFLDREVREFTRAGTALSTEYRFDGQTLCIRRMGDEQHFSASMGDLFCVNCNGGFPEVYKITPPEYDGTMLLWACGFHKPWRTYSYHNFVSTVRNDKKTYDWHEYTWYYWQSEGDYALAFCRHQECGNICHSCAWVRRNLRVTPELAVQLLEPAKSIGLLVFPDAFLCKILRERLSLSNEQLCKIGILKPQTAMDSHAQD